MDGKMGGRSKTAPTITVEKADARRRVYMWIALGLWLVAVLARVWAFGAVPEGVHQDGAMAALDAAALAAYGTDRFGMAWPVHLTAWGYGQMSALMSYLMAPFVKLFGLNIVAVRLPNLLMSLAGLGALYAFARKAFRSETAGLAVFAFAAINPWHIMQSRWALDCNLFPHLFMIGLWLVHKGATEKRLRWVLLSMVSFALCLYAYGIALYTVPLFLAGLCAVMLWRKLIDWRGALAAAGVFLLVSWPILTMVVINFFRWESVSLPFMTIPFFENSVRAKDMLFFSETPLAQLWVNVKALVKVVLLQDEWRPWHAVQGFGQMYLFSMPFAAVGFAALVVKAVRRQTDRFGALCVLAGLAMGVWAGVITTVTTHRINIIFYFVILLAGYGLHWLCSLHRLVKWPVVAAYTVAFAMFVSAYFTRGAAAIREWFWADMENALAYAAETESNSFHIIHAFPQVMDGAQMAVVLTAYTHELDAAYVRGETALTFADGTVVAPYAERYVFVDGAGEVPVPTEDAVYVYQNLDAAGVVIDETRFTVERFGAASVVISKNFAD